MGKKNSFKLLRIPTYFDWILLAVVFILLLFGILTIYSSSYAEKSISLALNQGIFAAIGLFFAVFFAKIDYRALKSYNLLLYFFGITLLVVVLILGKTTLGATRWIDFGIFQLQPSEIFKFILIIFLAKLLSDNTVELNFKRLILIIALAVLPTVLVLFEPDLGTALVFIVITFSMIIAAGAKRIYLLIIGSVGLLLAPIFWLMLKSYQKERILNFLNPSRDPLGTGYNVIQSIIAVGSGQITGRGLGEGSQSQLNFLPIKHSDFIFAVYSEQLGFAGAMILFTLFLLLFFRLIGVAKLARDNFGMLLAVGTTAMIIFQVLVNVGMNMGIMPVTGIPLPFVSSGGTSLIVNLALIGLMFSIILRHRKMAFGD